MILARKGDVLPQANAAKQVSEPFHPLISPSQPGNGEKSQVVMCTGEMYSLLLLWMVRMGEGKKKTGEPYDSFGYIKK